MRLDENGRWVSDDGAYVWDEPAQTWRLVNPVPRPDLSGNDSAPAAPAAAGQPAGSYPAGNQLPGSSTSANPAAGFPASGQSAAHLTGGFSVGSPVTPGGGTAGFRVGAGDRGSAAAARTGHPGADWTPSGPGASAGQSYAGEPFAGDSYAPGASAAGPSGEARLGNAPTGPIFTGEAYTGGTQTVAPFASYQSQAQASHPDAPGTGVRLAAPAARAGAAEVGPVVTGPVRLGQPGATGAHALDPASTGPWAVPGASAETPAEPEWRAPGASPRSREHTHGIPRRMAPGQQQPVAGRSAPGPEDAAEPDDEWGDGEKAWYDVPSSTSGQGARARRQAAGRGAGARGADVRADAELDPDGDDEEDTGWKPSGGRSRTRGGARAESARAVPGRGDGARSDGTQGDGARSGSARGERGRGELDRPDDDWDDRASDGNGRPVAATGPGGLVGRVTELVRRPTAIPIAIAVVLVAALGMAGFLVLGGGDGTTTASGPAVGEGRYDIKVRKTYVDACLQVSNGNERYCTCTLEKLEAKYSEAEYVAFSRDVESEASQRIVREVYTACRNLQ